MAVLAVFFLLSAVVWGILLLRYGSVSALGWTTLAVGTIFGPPFFHVDGPFQISAERVLWVALLGMFFVHWRLGRTESRRWSRGDWLLVAFVLYAAASTQRGLPPSDGSSPVARWLFYIAMPCGMYWVGRGARIDAVALHRGAQVLVGIAVYLAIMAVFESSGWHGLVFPRFIVDPEIWEFYGRGRGPLLNPAANGIVMTIGLAAALVQIPRASRAGQLGYGVATAIILAGCYATLTRCVWLGAAVVFAMVALSWMSRPMRVWSLAALIVFGGMGGWAFKDDLLMLKRDKNLSPSASLESVELRPLLAVVALEMFRDHPLLGVGYGHYFGYNTAYTQARHWEMPLENVRPYMQHNILLSVLVDCGLIGLAMYAGLILWWTSAGLRLAFGWVGGDQAGGGPPGTFRGVTSAGSPQAGTSDEARRYGWIMLATVLAYGINGVFQDVTVLPMVHMYLMFMAGIAVGLVASPAPAHQGGVHPLLVRVGGVSAPASPIHGARC